MKAFEVTCSLLLLRPSSPHKKKQKLTLSSFRDSLDRVMIVPATLNTCSDAVLVPHIDTYVLANLASSEYLDWLSHHQAKINLNASPGIPLALD